MGVTVAQPTTLQQKCALKKQGNRKWRRNTSSPFFLLFLSSPPICYSFSGPSKFSLFCSPNGGCSLVCNLMEFSLCKCLERPSINCSHQIFKVKPEHAGRLSLSLKIMWCVIKQTLLFNARSFYALRILIFQEKGQVLFLEVVVLFSFLLSFTTASPLIGAILRLHKCACSIVFLCFGCVSHNYNCSRTTGHGSAPDTMPVWDHGCISSSSTPWLRWRGTARDQERAAWSA